MHGGSSARFPTKPTEKLKIEKMYAIKQIKICAEYRDMLPRPRLDLSGTPGLRPIGLSPGSWQTSLGLGSMSRYSAKILICITYVSVYILETRGFGFDYFDKTLRSESCLYTAISLSSLARFIKRCWSPYMLIRFILSSGVCQRLSQFPPLSFVRYIGLCVLNLSIFSWRLCEYVFIV